MVKIKRSAGEESSQSSEAGRISDVFLLLADDAIKRFIPMFRALVASKQITLDRGGDVVMHLAAETLRRAGLISYISTDKYRAEIEKFQLDHES